MNDGEKVDISKIRPGDRVTLVPLEVRSIQPGAIRVWFPRFGEIAFTPDQIATHHPAPREFQVGDDVMDTAQLRGTILALAEGYAMVRWPQGNVTAKICSRLFPVEGGE